MNCAHPELLEPAAKESRAGVPNPPGCLLDRYGSVAC